MKTRRQWALDAGQRYFGRGSHSVAECVPDHWREKIEASDLVWLQMPRWAGDWSVDGELPAFAPLIGPADGQTPPWQRCDWLSVAAHLMDGTLERAHELQHGPVLSYSSRLTGIDKRLFDHAWVNRIFLFLREWVARETQRNPAEPCGPLPLPQIMLTHDVDAIRLTPEIRFKQAAFDGINVLRALMRAEFASAAGRLIKGLRFVTRSETFETLGLVRDLEREAGLTSTLHFYAGPPGLRRGTPKKILIDPAYDIAGPYLASEIKRLREGGWMIGLHQSFDAWDQPASMHSERSKLEKVAGPVFACRQHWLHFSWERTWRAQAAAGLALDSTLGFNDRPGFRASHALRLTPWDHSRSKPMQDFSLIPMLFMDSQFYDYSRMSGAEIGAAMKPWLDEIRAVHGVATVNWHTQVLTDAYGWRPGFEELLAQLS